MYRALTLLEICEISMLSLGCFVPFNINCLGKNFSEKGNQEHFSIPTVAAITGKKIHICRAQQIRAEL